MRSHNVTLSSPLLTVIENVVKSEGISRERLSTAVLELSRLFTIGRSALSGSYLESPAFAAAYLNYFLPVNLSKIQVLLDEMPVEQADEPFSVLDLGSGPGTGALAVLDWWHGRGSVSGLSVVAVDRSMTALHQAESLWSKYCRTAGSDRHEPSNLQGRCRTDWMGKRGQTEGSIRSHHSRKLLERDPCGCDRSDRDAKFSRDGAVSASRTPGHA